MCLRTGRRTLEQPLIMNPGMSSSPADLVGFSRLMALIMSKSEAVAKGNESKNGWMGKTAGPERLYTDWKCLLNSSATSAGWILRLPSTVSWMD
jgi:hypothetical protein